MKFLQYSLMVLVLLALPITASAYSLSWDNLTDGGQVALTVTGGVLQTKPGANVTAMGISGGVAGEINTGEAMKFSFSNSQYVKSLDLAFLFPAGQYDDTANEIATIKVESSGLTYTYSLTATGINSASWTGDGSLVGSSVANVFDAETGDDGVWSITKPFGDLIVDSVLLTVLSTPPPGSKCGCTGNNYDFSFLAMSTTPIPGAVWLLGAGLMGLLGLKRRRQE